jgi:hypothetical protein
MPKEAQMTKISARRRNCEKSHEGNVPTGRLSHLAESQAGPWRHRCAACAYEMGVADGLKASLKPRLLKGGRAQVHAIHKS